MTSNEPDQPAEPAPENTEATVAYPPGSFTLSGPSMAGRFAFLSPPRFAGDLGWLAHYRVKSLIGEGAIGLVFLAEDANLARPVALKVIKPELAAEPKVRSRFVREAQAMAALKDDHIVTIYQVGRDGATLFLAMEYLRGLSLQGWLDRDRPVSPQATLRIGREVALGLAAAHGVGLVHRDIKPANIWLESPTGRVKVLDFGLARSERDEVRITHHGTIIGTPAYMSPEQAAGATATIASDLFSLGCILYRLTAGRPPFEGPSIIAVLSALAVGKPRPLNEVAPAVNPAFVALVMSLLAHDPAQRPASARAVADAIEAIERDPATTALGHLVNFDPAPVPGVGSARPLLDPPTRPARPRGWQIAAGVVALVGAIVAATVLALTRPTATPPPPNLPTTDLVAIEPPPVPAPTPATVPPPPPSVPIPVPEPVVASNPPAVEPPPAPVPTPPPVMPPAPEAVVVGDWGDPVDPDGDCKVTLNPALAEIQFDVPGRPHLLSAGLGLVNAPRLLRPVRGDFDVSVGLKSPPKPKGPTTVRQFPSPYHGAGLLLWEDERNYVRLEIAAELRQGRIYSYANFEHFDDGKLAVSQGREIKDGSTQIRLERRGLKLTASFSPDGERWTELAPMTIDLGDRIGVGVAALNSAANRLVVDFRMFTLTPKPRPAGADPKP